MTPKNIFSRQSKIVLFDDNKPLGEVASEPTVWDDNNEPITPTMGAPLSFSFDINDDYAQDSLKDLFHTEYPPQGHFICSVSIGEKEYIYRPSNLKYPNKKRAKRIWKKWKKRYGSRNSPKMFIPKARIMPTIEGATIECLTPNPQNYVTRQN